METKNSYKNHEGYPDPTPYEAIHNIDRAEARAYYLNSTIISMARLTGFQIETLVTVDRDGNRFDSAELKRKHDARRASEKTD